MDRLKYLYIVGIAVATTFLFHEGTHWIMGKILGYDMVMTLNKAYPLNHSFAENWHYTLVSIVGPIATLFQSVLLFFLIRKHAQKYLYPFLFSAVYLEFLSGVMNFWHANDLGRVSSTFNLGLWTLPLVFILIHLFLLYKTAKRDHYSLYFNLLTLLYVIIYSSAWILTNQHYNVIILPG